MRFGDTAVPQFRLLLQLIGNFLQLVCGWVTAISYVKVLLRCLRAALQLTELLLHLIRSHLALHSNVPCYFGEHHSRCFPVVVPDASCSSSSTRWQEKSREKGSGVEIKTGRLVTVVSRTDLTWGKLKYFIAIKAIVGW